MSNSLKSKYLFPLDIIIIKDYRKTRETQRNTMKQQRERWVSGLNHRFAKPAKGAIPSEGSNPSLSATDY